MIIELTPQAKAIVSTLLKTGLYGATEADVVERLFYDKLRELSARNNRRPPDDEMAEPIRR